MDFKLNISPHCQKRINQAISVYKKANIWRYSNSARYVAYLNDFYNEEVTRRAEGLISLDTDDKRIAVLQHVSIREMIIDWCVDWCFTFDPRLPAAGLPSTLPWIPWPQQIEFVQWFYVVRNLTQLMRMAIVLSGL